MASGPAMLAAPEALGHRTLLVPASVRSDETRRLLESLSKVRWERGDHWFGVLGKGDEDRRAFDRWRRPVRPVLRHCGRQGKSSLVAPTGEFWAFGAIHNHFFLSAKKRRTKGA